MAASGYDELTATKMYEECMGTKRVEPPSDVTLRRATLEDYPSVMEMSEGLFKGNDHLPAVYKDCLQDPLCDMFVALRNQQVIAFCMHHVLDDGKAMLGETARSHPSVRQKKVYESLVGYSWAETLKASPNVRTIRTTTHNIPFLERIAERSARGEIIYVKHYVTITDGAAIEDVLRATEPAFKAKMAIHLPLHKIRLLTSAQDLATMFNDPHLVEEFFPHGIFNVGGAPFAPMVQNIPALMSKNRYYAISMGKMSFCSAFIYQCPNGICMQLATYGNDVTSADIITYVITFLPIVAQNYRRGKVVIHVGVQDEGVVQDVVNLCGKLPFCDQNTKHDVVPMGTASVQASDSLMAKL